MNTRKQGRDSVNRLTRRVWKIFVKPSCLAETLIFLSGGLQASLPSGAVLSFDNRAKASLHDS
jgi:hypothetical protein